MSFIIGTPHLKNCGHSGYRNGGDDMEYREADIQTCPHCQKVIDLRKWASATTQNFCLKCMKPACDQPGCVDCVPFLKKLDLQLDAVIKYTQHMKLAGLEPPLTLRY